METETVVRGSDLEVNANVSTVRRVFIALTTKEAVAADEFISPRYLDHDAPGPDDATSLVGPAQFRASIGWLHRKFADLTFEEHEVIAVDDRVVVRGTMRGTHVGALLGIAPTDTRVEIQQVHIFRLDAEKVVEHRALWGELSLLAQLCAVPTH
jgi:predicted ester cyclase